MRAAELLVIGAAFLLAGGVEGKAAGAEIHTFHCLHGCPMGTPATNDLIVREIYSLSSNDQTKFADWVAYRVTIETIGSTQNRTWRVDPWLDSDETLAPPDYDGANAALGTDRGHQAPLAAFTGTPYWPDTNYLSNITPQAANLNQGPWERLEAAERNLARNENVAVYVVTGPLYERVVPPMPSAAPHHRPSGYWKAIVLESGEAASFIFDQETPRNADFCEYQVSLEEVEFRSRLDLMPRANHLTFADLAEKLGC